MDRNLAFGTSQFSALLVASVFPVVSIVISAVRTRRLEVFAALSLATTH